MMAAWFKLALLALAIVFSTADHDTGGGDSQNTENDPKPTCRLTPATRPRDPKSPFFGVRPPADDSEICSSDPRYNSTEKLFLVNVHVRDEQCRPIAGLAVDVEQADSSGIERADCGGRLVTNEFGVFSFASVRPKHYIDAEYGRRPRTIQFRVRSGECNDELLTQFYLRKDRRRQNDPCPDSECQASDERLFFESSRRRVNGRQTVRDNVVYLTVARTCSSIAPSEINATPKPATETPTTEATTTEAATADAETTPAAVRTVPPTPCPNPDPTPWDTTGPFYKANQPRRDPMCRNDPFYHQALKLELTVHVRDQDCNNLANVAVDVWNADNSGDYRDYCRSLERTNSSGMFTMRAIKPAVYIGRPRHIHYIVHASALPPTANGCRYSNFNTQSYWSDRWDNRRLIKKCTDVFDQFNRKTGEKCLFVITLRRPC